MRQLRWKISRTTARAILRLVVWVCNRGWCGGLIWDLLTCLRGFDRAVVNTAAGYALTEFTTGRICAFLGFKSERFLIRNFPLSIEEQTERDRLLGLAGVRFAGHYTNAVKAIRELYRYDLEFECPLAFPHTEEPWKPAWKS